MGDGQPLLLLEAYRRAFYERQQYIANIFPVDEGLVVLIERNIIDNDCHLAIVNLNGKVDEQRSRVVEYLLKKNEIKRYNEFLNVCQRVAPEIVKIIVPVINKCIKDVGLLYNLNNDLKLIEETLKTPESRSSSHYSSQERTEDAYFGGKTGS